MMIGIVVIPRAAYKAFKRFSEDYRGEVGGYLYGDIKKEKNVILFKIRCVLIPKQKTTTATVRYNISHDYAIQLGKRMGLELLGTIHVHPPYCGSLSAVDIETAMAISRLLSRELELSENVLKFGYHWVGNKMNLIIERKIPENIYNEIVKYLGRNFRFEEYVKGDSRRVLGWGNDKIVISLESSDEIPKDLIKKLEGSEITVKIPKDYVYTIYILAYNGGMDFWIKRYDPIKKSLSNILLSNKYIILSGESFEIPKEIEESHLGYEISKNVFIFDNGYSVGKIPENLKEGRKIVMRLEDLFDMLSKEISVIRGFEEKNIIYISKDGKSIGVFFDQNVDRDKVGKVGREIEGLSKYFKEEEVLKEMSFGAWKVGKENDFEVRIPKNIEKMVSILKKYIGVELKKYERGEEKEVFGWSDGEKVFSIDINMEEEDKKYFLSKLFGGTKITAKYIKKIPVKEAVAGIKSGKIVEFFIVSSTREKRYLSIEIITR